MTSAEQASPAHPLQLSLAPESVGFAAYTSAAQPAGLLLGFVNEGAVSFEAASLTPGARIAGSFEGQVFQTNCYE